MSSILRMKNALDIKGSFLLILLRFSLEETSKYIYNSESFSFWTKSMSSLSDRHDFTESLKADCSIAGLKLFIDCPKNIFVSDGIIAILIFLGFTENILA